MELTTFTRISIQVLHAVMNSQLFVFWVLRLSPLRRFPFCWDSYDREVWQNWVKLHRNKNGLDSISTFLHCAAISYQPCIWRFCYCVSLWNKHVGGREEKNIPGADTDQIMRSRKTKRKQSGLDSCDKNWRCVGKLWGHRLIYLSFWSRRPKHSVIKVMGWTIGASISLVCVSMQGSIPNHGTFGACLWIKLYESKATSATKSF